MLHGRAAEQAAIGVLLDEAWASRGGAMVLRGQPGAGKSALLADTAARAEGMRLLRTQGVEPESPLAFAALHRLLRPVASGLARLPARQARALRAAFGEVEDADTDRFVVFLGALSLLADAAEDSPVLVIVDDAHWLDDASAAALAFIARRVQTERIAMVFAARDDDGFTPSDLPVLTIAGLDPTAGVELLGETAGVAVPPEVAAQLVARTGGNPLALVELPRALSADQLTGQAPLPPQLPVTEGIERVFLDRARRLPGPAQTVLLVAAIDDSGRAATLRTAMAALGLEPDALDAAERSGLLLIHDGDVRLRHPLVGSAIAAAATSSARRSVHRALADTTDPDRRAWHLADAAEDVDETVACELGRVAERARSRGGQEAASAALERAAQLTPTLGNRRGCRRYGAAMAAWLAGQPVRARTLADTAWAEVDDPLLCADVALMRARIEWNTGSIDLGHRRVLSAAQDVLPTSVERARELAMFAAALASFGAAGRRDLDPATLIPPAGATDNNRVRCFDELMRGLTRVPRADWAAAARHLRAAFALSDEFDELDETDQDLLPNLGIAAMHLHDDDALLHFHGRLLTRARDTGATIMILYSLSRQAVSHIATGRWTIARTGVAEARQLVDGIGQPGLAALPVAWDALLSALRGQDPDDDLGQLERLAAHPQGTTAAIVRDVGAWARGVAEPQPGRALQQFEQIALPVVQRLAAIDRIEVAVHADRADLAAVWTADLAAFAEATGSSWAAAVAAHGQALLATGDAAEQHFEAALRQHARSTRRFDAARTALAYGEQLRRARRRVDARGHLRAALAVFDDLDARLWAERARQELRASGETARRRDADGPALTPQELQVATLVAQGMPNRDVAGQLFVSPRTVEFHLRNVFAKLGISSRAELARVHLR
jgi:DNA-binding NarL/FixJ family response regulator